MLYDIFNQILAISATATFVIAAVFIVRIMMRRMPRKYSYLLWMIVGIRLLCPYAAPSPASLFNVIEPEMRSVVPVPSARTETDNGNRAKNSNATAKNSNPSQKTAALQSPTDNAPLIKASGNAHSDITFSEKQVTPLADYAALIWIIGLAALLLKNIISALRMKRRCKTAVRYQDNIYECDNLPSPFVMGFLRPRIYIPFRLEKEDLTFILEHERYHIRRKDYIVKPAAFLLACVYWFHPLVWLSYFLMVRDMEISCDEHVLQNANTDIRESYSLSLLGFASNQRGMTTGTAAFGETETRRRIKNVLNFKKRKKSFSVIAIILVIITGIACLTNPVEKDAPKAKPTEKQEDTVAIEIDNVVPIGWQPTVQYPDAAEPQEGVPFYFENLDVTICLPENKNWIQNPAASVEKETGCVTYHDGIADTDVTLRFAEKDNESILKYSAYSAQSLEAWSYFTGNKENMISIQFYDITNGATTAVLSWDFYGIQFYMYADLLEEHVSDWTALAKTAAYIAEQWCTILEGTDTQSFTDADIQNAKKTVKRYFKKHFPNCNLLKIQYDEATYRSQAYELEHRYGTNRFILLVSDFYVSKLCELNSLNKDATYKDFRWILVENKKNEWKVKMYGY